MKKILIGWFAVLVTVITLWNTGCSDGLFGQTDMMMLTTNWDMSEMIMYMKLMYIGSNTNEITNYTITSRYSPLTNLSVYCFKPYGKFEWFLYSNNTAIETDSATYIVNQGANKLTIYMTNSNLLISYKFESGDDLRFFDLMILTNNTNTPLFGTLTNDLGNGTNLIFYDYEFKMTKSTN